MAKKLEITVEPEFATDLLVSLTAVDGVEVQVANRADASSTEREKEHGMYSLAAMELTTLVLNVTGTLASLTTIAAILLDRRMKAAQIKAKDYQAGDAKPVGNLVVPLSKFSTPEELAGFLKDCLK